MSSEGNPNLIVTASRAVAAGQANLINAAKAVARDADPDEKNRLLKGVTDLAAAVKAMLASAGTSANDPADSELHKKLREAAVAVAEATKGLLGDTSIKEAAVAALRTASKALASSTTTLVAECKGVSPQLDAETKNSMLTAAAQAATAVAALVAGVKDSWNNPKNSDYEKKLVTVAGAVAKPASGLVASARAGVPKVRDAQDKKNLNSAAASVSDSLRKMLEALSAVKEADGHMEVDEAMQDFAAAQADLEYALHSAREGSFEPLKGQTRDGAIELLQLSTRALRDASDDLVDKAKVSPQAMGTPAKATTSAVGQVFGAAKAVASTTDSKPAQTKILGAAKNVAVSVERLINAGRAVSTNPSDAELNNNMNTAQAAVGSAIDQLLTAATNSGAGSDECDNASEVILRGALEILTGYAGGAGSADLQELAEELETLCKALNAAASQVADSARNNPKALGGAANLTASTMPPILKAANAASTKSPDAVAGENILNAGKKLADDTADFLQAAKGVAASPDDSSAGQQLSQGLRTVKDDITELLHSVDAAVPGKRDLLEAQMVINAATNRLTLASVGTGNSQVHLREINEAARALAEAIGRIVASARNFPEKLGPYGKQAAESVSDIVDASKDASAGDPAAVVFLSANKLSRDTKKIADDPRDTAAVIDGAKDSARDASALMKNVLIWSVSGMKDQ